jgi:hypothetical protein
VTTAERRVRGKRLGRVLIVYWKGEGCSRCGTPVPPEQIHLHHRAGTEKRFNIGDWSQRSDRSLRTLAAELAKCDPLCRSCHDDEHREQHRARAVAARRDNAGRFLAAA